MREITTRQLYSYWNEVRGGRIAPKRFEIEPARIASLLPETFILERSADGRLRFRVSGSRLSELFRRDFRGVDLQTLWSVEDRKRVSGVLHAVVDDGGVGLIRFEATTVGGTSADLEMSLLPMLHTGEGITRVLGAVAGYVPPAATGQDVIDRIAVVATDVVWPDGRPFAVMSRMDAQPVLSTYPAHSRVVVQDRRAFRVFEGGRSREREKH